VAAMILR